MLIYSWDSSISTICLCFETLSIIRHSEFKDQILRVHVLFIHSNIDSNHFVFSFCFRFFRIYNLFNLSILLKIFHRLDEILMNISFEFEINWRFQTFAFLDFICLVDVLINKQFYRFEKSMICSRNLSIKLRRILIKFIFLAFQCERFWLQKRF
jgi:hypothetical protein